MENSKAFKLIIFNTHTGFKYKENYVRKKYIIQIITAENVRYDLLLLLQVYLEYPHPPACTTECCVAGMQMIFK